MAALYGGGGGGGEGCTRYRGELSPVWGIKILDLAPRGEKPHVFTAQCTVYSDSQYTDENVHQDLGSSSHGEKPPGIECSAVKPKGERVRGLPHLVLSLLHPPSHMLL